MTDRPRRGGMLRITLSTLVAGVLVLTSVRVADALTYTSAYDLVGTDIGNQKCFYVQSTAQKPYNSYDVLFKSFIYKKNRSTSTGCSFGNSNATFFSGESSVRAILYRTSDLTICAATGYTNTPAGYINWGISYNGWNRSGACSTSTRFIAAADGMWSNALGNFYDDGYTASFSLP